MSTVAVFLVKDEADIIESTVRHAAGHVDEILVADNMSTDGTWELLHELRRAGLPLLLERDEDPAYWQSKKVTRLALSQLGRHEWVAPIDADEAWHVNDTTRTMSEFLGGLAPDIMIVEAALYHHLPSAHDTSEPLEPNPLRRIGWRKRERAALPKVACRLRPDLVIEAGNHGATTSGTATRSAGMSVRHFSWRSAEQFVRKIRNGERAYALTNLPSQTGAHWRGWVNSTDEQIEDHFRTWFWSADPLHDDSLIFDPAPPPPPR